MKGLEKAMRKGGRYRGEVNEVPHAEEELQMQELLQEAWDDLTGAALDPVDVDELKTFCDHPGKPTRAEYVQDVRHAKRVKTGESDPGGGTAHPLLHPDAGEGPDLPEDVADQPASECGLSNLAWWDSVSYNDLGD